MSMSQKNRFLLLYGSQSGQAQAIAEEIADKAEVEGLYPEVHCLSLTEKKFFLERETCVVIVTSTTGDGEPPDTVLKFFRRLKKRTLSSDHLSQLNYALLGLGDSNYTNFCNCGKGIDRRLQELGAGHFYDSGWADDAVGLEVKVEPWIDGLWPALRKFLHLPDPESSDHNLRNGVRSLTTADAFNNTSNNAEIILPKEEVKSGNLDRMGSAIEKRLSNPLTSHLFSGEVTSGVKENKPNGNVNEIPDTNASHVKSSSIINTNLDSSTNKDTDLENGSCSCLKSEFQSDDASNLTRNDNTVVDSNINSPVTKSLEFTTNSMCVEVKEKNKSVVNSVKEEKTNMAAPETGNSLSGETMAASVKQSLPPLSESSLTLPALPPAFLKLEFNAKTNLNISELPIQNGCVFPSAASSVSMATVMSAVTLTSDSAVKKAMSVKLDTSGCDIEYKPGDSFSIVCPNPDREVETLLRRLSVCEKMDTPCTISVLADTKKRRAAVPQFLPSCGTLRHWFTTCLDFREPPKKAFLRVLADHAADPDERRRLQELCSKQGAEDYARFIRGPALSLQDLLDQFPSCCPPVERLIEHLPRLQPRPYSICSSPLTNPGSIQFVFNVVNIPEGSGRTYSRKGLCTGWLERIGTELNEESLNNGNGASAKQWENDVNVGDKTAKETTVEEQLVDRITDELQNVYICAGIKIPVFARTNQHFHLPDDITTPIIMIGPGTGVAPFIGFLNHRAALMASGGGETPGDTWLFYGCRNKEHDYLFRSEMESHVSTGTLSKLCVCFSRDDQPVSSPRYVQDSIRSHGRDLIRLLEVDNATVYVCGDASNMAKDVTQAFVDIYTNVKGLSAEDAKTMLTQLRLQKRYLEDVWT